MMRDDLDSPYAGAAIAACPSCGQPKGQGYGCAVLPQVPQVLDSGDSDAAALPDAPDAITLAIEVLEHIHAWATLDPGGARYPWIAIRTAEALAALLASAPSSCGWCLVCGADDRADTDMP